MRRSFEAMSASVVGLFGLVTLLAFPALAADAPKPARPATLAELFGDETIAQGKGVKVTSSQLEKAFISYRATVSARNQRITDDNRTRHEAQLLDRMIVTQLLTNRATAPDLTNAQRIAQKFVADAKKAAGDDEAFVRQLRATGITMEQFQTRAGEDAIAESVLERELKSNIKVSDAEVAEFYKTGTDFLVKLMQSDLDKLVADPSSKPAQVATLRERIDGLRKANLERLEQPETVRIAHVFVSTRDRKANEEFSAEQKRLKRLVLDRVRSRALAGEDFAKLIQEFSEDANLAETKGEYTVTRNTPFSAEFKSAAFSLEIGKISDVVTTPYGMHVVKVLEKTPAQKADFEKVSKDLTAFLHGQAVQKALPEFFTRLKKEAAVEIVDAKYRAALTELEQGKAP